MNFLENDIWEALEQHGSV